MGAIFFYKANRPYGFFSNFAPYPIEIDEKIWPTSEHYFQAMKFLGTKYVEEIRLTEKPVNAAKIGRNSRLPLRADWEGAKEEVMWTALEAKFTQHPRLMDRLLATGSAKLIEHTLRDSYWGDGGDGSGENRLGHLLMKLRDRYMGKWHARE